MRADKTATQDKSKADLVIVGECLIDIIIGTDGRKHSLFGGSPANIAVNSKQLGLEPLLFSTVGNDNNGRFLLDTLKSWNLNLKGIATANSATSYVIVTQSKATPASQFFRSSDHKINYTDALEKSLGNSTILHFSYWPLSKEPSKTTVFKAVRKAKDSGLIVAFDPNIHPALKSEESISKQELFALIGNVDIIKPSLDDAERLFGYKKNKEAYMNHFENLGTETIILTLGKAGVYVSSKGKRAYYPSEAKDIVDTTGAGDAFWAGFYAGTLNRMTLEKSIMLAQRASAAALKQIGAITLLPSIEELLT